MEIKTVTFEAEVTHLETVTAKYYFLNFKDMNEIPLFSLKKGKTIFVWEGEGFAITKEIVKNVSFFVEYEESDEFLPRNFLSNFFRKALGRKVSRFDINILNDKDFNVFKTFVVGDITYEQYADLVNSAAFGSKHDIVYVTTFEMQVETVSGLKVRSDQIFLEKKVSPQIP